MTEPRRLYRRGRCSSLLSPLLKGGDGRTGEESLWVGLRGEGVEQEAVDFGHLFGTEGEDNGDDIELDHFFLGLVLLALLLLNPGDWMEFESIEAFLLVLPRRCSAGCGSSSGKSSVLLFCPYIFGVKGSDGDASFCIWNVDLLVGSVRHLSGFLLREGRPCCFVFVLVMGRVGIGR